MNAPEEIATEQWSIEPYDRHEVAMHIMSGDFHILTNHNLEGEEMVAVTALPELLTLALAVVNGADTEQVRHLATAALNKANGEAVVAAGSGREQSMANLDLPTLRAMARSPQYHSVYALSGALHQALERMEVAERERDDAVDQLERIQTWCNAYPVDVFPEQDTARSDEVLRAAGISMSAMHGSWARRIVEGIGNIARVALEKQNDDR